VTIRHAEQTRDNELINDPYTPPLTN